MEESAVKPPRYQCGDTVRHRESGKEGVVVNAYLSLAGGPAAWRYAVRVGRQHHRWYEWAVKKVEDVSNGGR